MGEFIAVAFIIISFIGWIINQVNAQNRPAAPRRGPQRANPQRGNRRVQQEIDDFLREATGGRQPGRVLSADEIEIVDERPARPAPRRPAPARAQKRQKPGIDLSSRHLGGEEKLGSSVRDHLRTQMGERVVAGAEDYLSNSVDQLVSQHLGTFTAGLETSTGERAEAETLRHARTRAVALMAAFRTPTGVRNAVLMQEILSRPRSLRRHS